MKTVLITGATSGIGSEIAVKFAKNGWNLLCHYCCANKNLENLKKEISKYSVHCHFEQADFASKKQMESFVKKIKKITINSLINNAGTYLVNKHFSELSREEIETILAINVVSPMTLTFPIFMQMKGEKFGRIINISSIAAKYGGSSFSLPYGSSKMAMESMAKTLAREGAEHNVLINTIRPGVIDTDFHKKFPKDMEKRIAMIPMKRMGTAREIADVVYFLGSEQNTYITNETITISGGE